MRLFPNRLLLTAIEQEQPWEGLKDESVKLGKVAFPFTGKSDDQEVSLNEGDEVFYQYGTNVCINGDDFVLVRISDLICQK